MHRTLVPRRTAIAPAFRNWRPWLLLLAAVLLTILAYSPALHGGMVWDDDAHITKPALQSWHGLHDIWFQVRATLQYYPLLHSAFWLEHRFFGDATFGYHLANLFEHIAVALLAALALRRLAVPGAWLAAAVFAVHPVHVESVAWIAEQKNTLSTLFYLLTVLFYLNFDESRKRRWYAAAAGTFVLALVTKTVTATLPGAMLLVFWWRRGKLSWKRDVLPLVPFFVLGAGTASVTAWFELAVNNSSGPDFQFSHIERVLIAGRTIWFLLGKLFVPTNLAFMYPRWTLDATAWWQYLFPAGVVALAAMLWMFRGRSRAPLAAFLYFCGTLFPVLGFFNLYTFRYSFVANHYEYVASLGPIALVAAALTTLFASVPRRLRLVGAAAAIVVLAVATHVEARKFESMETLLQDTIAKDPRSWFAYNNLGMLRLEQGRLAEARQCFTKVLRLKPGLAVAYNNLGTVSARTGDRDNALRNHAEAVRLDPGYAEAHNNLGLDQANAGDVVAARASYERAIAINPRYALAHYNLANALVRLGDGAGAEAHYREAIALDAAFALGHYALGMQLLSEGRHSEAEAELDTAFRLKPDFAFGYYALGNVELRRGRSEEAASWYVRALGVNPAYAEAHCNLGVTLIQRNRIEEAIAEYREALRLKHNYPIAHNNLGFALEKVGRTSEAIEQYREALQCDPANTTAQENLRRVMIARQ